jgi:hypothetical protein
VGEPLDLTSHRDRVDDFEAVKEMTQTLMDVLTGLAIDVRDRYPARWASEVAA